MLSAARDILDPPRAGQVGGACPSPTAKKEGDWRLGGGRGHPHPSPPPLQVPPSPSPPQRLPLRLQPPLHRGKGAGWGRAGQGGAAGPAHPLPTLWVAPPQAVLLADILPTLLLKTAAPFLVHLLPYK